MTAVQYQQYAGIVLLQADIGRIRQVYDAFLAEYPLCYGYWKKYADAEAKYVSLEEASIVYDRGVAAVPYSVDLWGHYAMHKQKAGAPVEEVERSVSLQKLLGFDN